MAAFSTGPDGATIRSMTGGNANPPLVTRAFGLVVGSTFSAFVTIGILLPALPLYADERLDAGDLGVGLAVGAASITAFLAQPPSGRLGDRVGRRPLMIAGAAIMAAASLGYVAADSLELLVPLRLLSGVGEAALLVGAATTVTDLAPAERRGEALSLFTFACYGGLAAGPLLGGWLAGEGRFDAVWLAAAVSAALAGVLATRVSETRPEAKCARSTDGRFFARSGLLPGMALLMALFGFGGFNAFVALYAKDLGLERVGVVFLVFALVVMTIRLLGRRIPDLLGPALRRARARPARDRPRDDGRVVDRRRIVRRHGDLRDGPGARIPSDAHARCPARAAG